MAENAINPFISDSFMELSFDAAIGMAVLIVGHWVLTKLSFADASLICWFIFPWLATRVLIALSIVLIEDFRFVKSPVGLVPFLISASTFCSMTRTLLAVVMSVSTWAIIGFSCASPVVSYRLVRMASIYFSVVIRILTCDSIFWTFVKACVGFDAICVYNESYSVLTVLDIFWICGSAALTFGQILFTVLISVFACVIVESISPICPFNSFTKDFALRNSALLVAAYSPISLSLPNMIPSTVLTISPLICDWIASTPALVSLGAMGLVLSFTIYCIWACCGFDVWIDSNCWLKLLGIIRTA